MAVTTDPFTGSDLAGFIPEIWTPIVNEQFFASTVLSTFITDLSPYAAGGGDIFHVPDVFTNSFTAQTQSTEGAEVTTAGPAQVDTTLSITTHKYVAYLVGDMQMKQMLGSYDFAGVYARKAARTLADALEVSIAGLWSSITTNTVTGTSAALTDLQVRTAINKLDSTFYPLDEVAFFFHPTTFWTQLVAIQKYYDQSQAGPANMRGATRTGGVGESPTMTRTTQAKGMLYGIPVNVTANMVSGLQTFRNLLLHKSCLGFATQTQGDGPARVQADYLVQNLGTLAVADIIYGVGVLREPGGVVISTSNSATTS